MALALALSLALALALASFSFGFGFSSGFCGFGCGFGFGLGVASSWEIEMHKGKLSDLTMQLAYLVFACGCQTPATFIHLGKPHHKMKCEDRLTDPLCDSSP